MLCGAVPFKAHNMNDLHELILNGKYTALENVTKEAVDIVSKILTVDAKKRLTVDQILEHPWLNEDSSSNNISNKNKERCKYKISNFINLQVNLFTVAEKILLSKANIDYRSGNKEDLIENFTLKNLDTLQEAENQNVNTKSYILAPYNTSFKNKIEPLCDEIKIEDDIMKFVGKAKEANRNYELNNNEEIDNGILINPQNQRK